MNIPKNLHYTDTHEWVWVEDEIATVGITDFAQGELGDIIYLELPECPSKVVSNEPFGTIEAIKTVADLFAPVSGEVVEVNNHLEDSPEWVNEDPYGKGWIIKIKISNPSELDKLLDHNGYQKIIT